MRVLRELIPELPGHEGEGGPVIPQAVILREGAGGWTEVILVRRTSPRAWELPGGYLDPGEPPEDGVVREVREETGLEVQIDRLVGEYRRTGFRPHRSPVYACRVLGGAMRTSHEAVAIGAFPLVRLPWGLFPWYRPIIRDASAGVTHAHEQRQHLGAGAVAAAIVIHLGGVLGLIR